MKPIKNLSVLLVCSIFLICNSSGQDITLVEDGRAKSRIVIPKESTVTEQKAAAVMQDYFRRISGTRLKIVKDRKKEKGNEILVGKVNRPVLAGVDIDALGQDGFVIRTDGKHLLIAGGSEKGTLYGVYAYLENYLGCRKFSSGVSNIPSMKTITAGSINDKEVPWFKFRETHYRDAYDPEYMDWHKLDSHGKNIENPQWGFWCHSFNTLVPPEQFGETHPEYYSLLDGERKPGSQLCLTNPDVFDVTCENLKAEIEKNPDPVYWSVSQNDNLVSPFPNLRTLQPNIQYLHENRVTALFEQGNREVGGEFCELRAYLLAKLMWDPYIDVDSVMDDFLNGYYGQAGGYIRKYIDILHDEMENSGAALQIFGKPADAMETFLSDSLITVYRGIFDKAEQAVSGQPELLERVKTARLPVYYAILEIARDDGTLKPRPEIVEMLHTFVSQCNKIGVTRVTEWHTTPDEYLEKYNQ